MELDYKNATHVLSCRHAIGQSGKDYKMRCHVLKKMEGGKLKIQVYGDRHWKDTEQIVKIRYVESYRVQEIGE
ncbi:hypothetical protein A1QO_02530 [Vibrio genomosp. F10 str. ZF-129]|uniref:Uncharacterized protein n=2 Tax=Vibrio genomosp. F10 TaxID=723171 RepID=A0A1E5BK77_9VIBR|nr:hypothetical protein A1QO_02530 [Vibrio genomosp. F10 str. ZF-129]